MEEADKLLNDLDSIRGISAVISDDPEKIRSALSLVKDNQHVERYVRVKRSDDQIARIVGKIPAHERKKMCKVRDNIGNTSQTSGTVCVSLGANRKVKKMFYPLERKISDYKTEQLELQGMTLGFTYSEEPDRHNKLATKILGKNIYGTVYFFKIEDSSKADLSVEEFSRLFSL